MSEEEVARCYYFDANALYKYYRDEDGSLAVRRLVSSPNPIVVSNLSVLEVLSRLAKAYRKRHDAGRETSPLNKRTLNGIVNRLLKKDIRESADNRAFKLLPMPADAFKTAETVLCDHAIGGKISIGSLDALHLAFVSQIGTRMVVVTSDQPMQSACQRMELAYFDPLKTDNL